MSTVRIRAGRLVEPLRHEPATDEQIAAQLCEIHDAIDGMPGDPGNAYPLVDRVRAVVEEVNEQRESMRRRRNL
jgi:hypothetical protein